MTFDRAAKIESASSDSGVGGGGNFESSSSSNSPFSRRSQTLEKHGNLLRSSPNLHFPKKRECHPENSSAYLERRENFMIKQQLFKSENQLERDIQSYYACI